MKAALVVRLLSCPSSSGNFSRVATLSCGAPHHLALIAKRTAGAAEKPGARVALQYGWRGFSILRGSAPFDAQRDNRWLTEKEEKVGLLDETATIGTWDG